MAKTPTTDRPTRRKRGFEAAASLLRQPIRSAGEKRGFAETRLLTHWEEVVGPDIARIARPVDVKYGRDSFGATLTLLTTGANAPMLDMQKDTIRDKVNACYGYKAISKVRVTQTAPTGFSEGRVQFGHTPKPARREPDSETVKEAASLADGVADDGLRQALEMLARNVLTRTKPQGENG